MQSVVLEFHPSRLRLTGPVREQGHEHRVSQGLLFLVDVERSRVGDVGGRFRGVIVGRPGELVRGAEVGTVRLGELGRHVAVRGVDDQAARLMPKGLERVRTIHGYFLIRHQLPRTDQRDPLIQEISSCQVITHWTVRPTLTVYAEPVAA